MADESLYISTHEAALALVATSMKKARLRLDSLIVNSLMGGIVFSTGGMFHIFLQAHLPSTYRTDPGFVEMFQGFCYPIGLFYVVILGCELFNSNVLFFSVGFVRGAVSIIDVLISWFVSWWFNLVANIFVCYVICYYSDVFKTDVMITTSQIIVEHKASFTFVQTFIKGIAGNFFVSLAIYLQIMAKPLHVKFFLMLLPIFTFVTLGFTHSVADMFVLTMGVINGGKVTVATLAWKVYLPTVLGNIIGGSFFGIVIPWYSHIYLVELDQKALNLPKYDLRDEQPEINTDSRVVRTKSTISEELEFEEPKESFNSKSGNTSVGKRELMNDSLDTSENNSYYNGRHSPPHGIYDNRDSLDISRRASISSRALSSRSIRSRAKSSDIRSPKNVFPVYGMGSPLQREKSIASGYDDGHKEEDEGFDDEDDDANAEYVGSRIRKYFVRRFSNRTNQDMEKQSISSGTGTISPNTMRQYSLGSHKSVRTDANDFASRMASAGINNKAMGASDNVAGVASPSLAHTRSFASSRNNPSEATSRVNDIEEYDPKDPH